MDHFVYRGGTLHAEDVPVADVAATVGTPFYLYSRATLERHYGLFEEALAGTDHLICYAVKANSNLAVLKLRQGRIEEAEADLQAAGPQQQGLDEGDVVEFDLAEEGRGPKAKNVVKVG